MVERHAVNLHATELTVGWEDQAQFQLICCQIMINM
jgi:hypothetical protein